MASGNTNRAEKVADQEITITRVFDAPRALVFRAWTDPKRVARWWGPDGFTSPLCELDVRPGGAIRIDMRGPDGTVYPMAGEYREIVPPERLVFTSAALDDERTPLFEVLNTVTFAERGGKTALTLQAKVIRAPAGSEPYLEGMETGWTQSLERLAQDLATKGGGIMAKANEKPAKALADRTLVITRVFDAPRDLVFKAWTDPERAEQWWGPKGFHLTHREMDVRPGGRWRVCMHSPEGVDYWAQGVYREIVAPERFVYTWAWEKPKGTPGRETLVTVELAEHGDKTKMTFRQAEFETVEDRESHRGGWSESFDLLAEFLAKA